MSVVFIGGTGGSGTRMVSLFCDKAGYYIGDNVNVSRDAMNVEPLYNKYAKKYIENGPDEEMKECLKVCVKNHINSNTNPLCSIKNPRSLLMLPLIHSVYPNMKFIHVIRNGLSMSFSAHRRFAKKYGDLFVDGDANIDVSIWSPELAMKYWADTNINAYNYGVKYLKSNYLLLKYEELCSKKKDTYGQLVSFLGCSSDIIPALMRKTKIPETWKRGKTDQDKELITKLEKIGKNAIKTFGYDFICLKK